MLLSYTAYLDVGVEAVEHDRQFSELIIILQQRVVRGAHVSHAVNVFSKLNNTVSVQQELKMKVF